ncbi:MAG: pyridoxamine 5'-phosphate oxidase family protein [Burkholderiales bacterium]
MKTQPQAAEEMKHLAELLEDQRVAMLTLAEASGQLSSRPMTPLELDAAGAIWMFTSRKTLAHDFGVQPRAVNLAFSDAGNSTYVSIEARAHLVEDQQRKHELWSAMARPWFPGGEDDPDLVLLKLEPQRAEVWNAPDSGIVRSLAIAASIAAAKPVGLGDHEVITPSGAPLR